MSTKFRQMLLFAGRGLENGLWREEEGGWMVACRRVYTSILYYKPRFPP